MVVLVCAVCREEIAQTDQTPVEGLCRSCEAEEATETAYWASLRAQMDDLWLERLDRWKHEQECSTCDRSRGLPVVERRVFCPRLP